MQVRGRRGCTAWHVIHSHVRLVGGSPPLRFSAWAFPSLAFPPG